MSSVLQQGSQPFAVTVGDGTWTNLEVTDAKFNPSESSPPRWRREGNVIRLAGFMDRVGEAALAAWFAVLPEAARPHNEDEEAANKDVTVPLAFHAKGGAAVDGHVVSTNESGEGKMRLLSDPAEGAQVCFDGITWTTD